jgi:hypothetical protein
MKTTNIKTMSALTASPACPTRCSPESGNAFVSAVIVSSVGDASCKMCNVADAKQD